MFKKILLMLAIFLQLKSVDISKLRKIDKVSTFQSMNTDLKQQGAFIAEYCPTEGLYAGKTVKVFGTLHTTYQDGIPFKMACKLIDSLPEKSAVLIEEASFLSQLYIGKQADMDFIIDCAKSLYEPSFTQKIKSLIKKPLFTEMSFAAYLGRKKGHHVECADLSYQETLERFKDNGYTEKDIFSYGVSLAAPYLGFSVFYKFQYDFIIKKFVERNLSIKQDIPFEGIVEFLNFEKHNIMFFDHIYFRDQCALQLLFSSLLKYETVVIIFGGWHWNLWQDVLEYHLGSPIVKYYSDFLNE